VFLPLLLRQLPPTPSPTPTTPPYPAVPVLDPITPPEASPSYTIHWAVAPRAESYVLERATDGSFTDRVEVYRGPATNYEAASAGIATYHYRVKARNAWGDSEWSNVQTVEVRWELEPNDQIVQLDGRSRLIFGQEHHGVMASDADVNPDINLGRDYLYFDLETAGPVEIWLRSIPAGSDYDLYVRPEWDIRQIVGQSAQSGNTDEHIVMAALPAGHRYFVQVYNRNRMRSAQPYRLTVSHQ
jgi:hypothetical protein